MRRLVGRKAVVTGAARTLADFFGTVAVLERDSRRRQAIPRPGVPHGRQPHLLLHGGLLALCALFPAFP
jgi:hypothetical protein